MTAKRDRADLLAEQWVRAEYEEMGEYSIRVGGKIYLSGYSAATAGPRADHLRDLLSPLIRSAMAEAVTSALREAWGGDGPAVDVAAVRARAEAATPGPWKIDTLGMEVLHEVVKDTVLIGPDSKGLVWIGNRDCNRAFIEHARQDVPALCDRIDWLEARVVQLLTDDDRFAAGVERGRAMEREGGAC